MHKVHTCNLHGQTACLQLQTDTASNDSGGALLHIQQEHVVPSHCVMVQQRCDLQLGKQFPLPLPLCWLGIAGQWLPLESLLPESHSVHHTFGPDRISGSACPLDD